MIQKTWFHYQMIATFLLRKLIAEDWQSIQQRRQENLYAI